jgi:hypothetical protein
MVAEGFSHVHEYGKYSLFVGSMVVVAGAG